VWRAVPGRARTAKDQSLCYPAHRLVGNRCGRAGCPGCVRFAAAPLRREARKKATPRAWLPGEWYAERAVHVTKPNSNPGGNRPSAERCQAATSWSQCFFFPLMEQERDLGHNVKETALAFSKPSCMTHAIALNNKSSWIGMQEKQLSSNRTV
jgi:hypothetical protein